MTSVSSVDKKIICSICLEDVDPRGNESTTLQCQHTFHQKCIRAWHAFQVNCPLCRQAGPEQSSIVKQMAIIKQRIHVFSTEPQVIIGDEPTASLDQKSTKEVMELLQTLARVYKISQNPVKPD